MFLLVFLLLSGLFLTRRYSYVPNIRYIESIGFIDVFTKAVSLPWSSVQHSYATYFETKLFGIFNLLFCVVLQCKRYWALSSDSFIHCAVSLPTYWVASQLLNCTWRFLILQEKKFWMHVCALTVSSEQRQRASLKPWSPCPEEHWLKCIWTHGRACVCALRRKWTLLWSNVTGAKYNINRAM